MDVAPFKASLWNIDDIGVIFFRSVLCGIILDIESPRLGRRGYHIKGRLFRLKLVYNLWVKDLLLVI